jgi:hypothetical protein
MDQNYASSNLPKRDLPNATAVLVLGIVSIVGCMCYGLIGAICGIIALVLNSKDKKLLLADPDGYTESSVKNLNAGRICAIIGLCLSALYLAFLIIWIIIYGFAIFSNMPWQQFNH